MRSLPSLSGLRAFEAAARHQSFKRAAQELSVTPTAISHQVRALEAQLELPLFERKVRQVALTAAGARLFPILRDGFDGFAAAIAALAPASSRAEVTVSATPAFTSKWLLPRVGLLQARHPHIDLRLHASNATVDLNDGRFDLAIRYGTGAYPKLASQALIVDRFGPVASPLLKLKRRSELPNHPLIHFEWHRPDPRHPSWPRWLRAARVDKQSRRKALFFSEETHAIEAAIAGQGVALLSLTLVADELSRGLLVAPFGPELPGFTHFIVHSRARPLTPAAQIVRSWLVEQAAF